MERNTYVPLLLLLSCFLAVAFGLSAYNGLNYQVEYPERVPQSISTIRNLIATLLCAATIVLVLSQRRILAWKIFAGTVVFAVGSAIVVMVING